MGYGFFGERVYFNVGAGESMLYFGAFVFVSNEKLLRSDRRLCVGLL
jgi:hypothetical protein